MAAFCAIARDENKEIQAVYAPNEKESVLYKDILESVNDKEEALKIWARAYTPSFKESFGDWELISKAKNFQDDIKGVYKDLFKSDPQRMMFEVSVQSHSSQIENKGAIDSFGKDIVSLSRELFPNAKVNDNYKPVIERTLDENGEPLAISVMNKTEKQQQTKLELVTNDVKYLTPLALAQRLSEKMGIPFEFSTAINSLGAVRDGKVLVNPTNLAPDTVFHEFSHLFVEAIRKQNPKLYANLSQRAGDFSYNGQKISDFVRENNPELKEGTNDFISELITTAIGLEGQQSGAVNDKIKFGQWLGTIFRQIAEYINKLIDDPSQHINPADLNISMTIKDLTDLMKIENKIELGDIARDYSADQTASQLSWGSRDTIDFFERQGADVKLDEGTDTTVGFYTNGSIDPITNTLRKFQRLTEFTYANFANPKNPFDPEKWLDQRTTDEFKKAGAELTEKINYGANPIPQSYDEVKADIKKSYEESRIRGKIMHKMIEGYLKFKDINHFSDDIETLREQSNLSEYDLLWFDEKNIQRMLEQIGINTEEFNNTDVAFRDNVASELMMVSDALGIGTSNDGIIEHSDKSVSFIDYKTGSKFLSDENTIRKMQYTNGLSSPVFDSKLDRAKIELVNIGSFGSYTFI